MIIFIHTPSILNYSCYFDFSKFVSIIMHLEFYTYIISKYIVNIMDLEKQR
jgi:hypothetical protein